MPIQTLFSALNPNDCDIVGVATERRHQDDQMAPIARALPLFFCFIFSSLFFFCSFSLVTFVTERPRLRLDSPVTQQGGPSGILEKERFFLFFFSGSESF